MLAGFLDGCSTTLALLQFIVCFTEMFYEVDCPLLSTHFWNWHVKDARILVCADLKP